MLTIGDRSKTLKVVSFEPDDILFNIDDDTFHNFAKLCHIISFYGTDTFARYLENDTKNIRHSKQWLGNPQNFPKTSMNSIHIENEDVSDAETIVIVNCVTNVKTDHDEIDQYAVIMADRDVDERCRRLTICSLHQLQATNRINNEAHSQDDQIVLRMLFNTKVMNCRTFHDATKSESISFTEDKVIHLSLRRLRSNGLLTKSQWNMLYAHEKSSVVFPPHDLSLLILVLKYTGLIAVPKPNGWLGEPVSTDQSKGADLIRFQMIRKQLANLTKLYSNTMSEILVPLKSVFCHFGAVDIEQQLDDIIQNDITENDAIEAVEFFKFWHKREEKLFDLETKIEVARGNRLMEIPVLQKPITLRDQSTLYSEPKLSLVQTNKLDTRENSNNWNKWADVKLGIQGEEKDVLRKFYSRLINEVRPDSMIDQLLSKKVLTVEESGEVFSTLKSSEQMGLLLNFLVTKTGTAFTEFLNALQPRYFELYTALYKEYQNLKEEVLLNKPEGVSYCHKYLVDRYQRLYKKWNPILWYPDTIVSLESFYCPLHLLDSNGSQMDPVRVLSSSTKMSLPRVSVIEGDAGTGKSYLSHYLASRWSGNVEIFETENPIKVLFHLDLKLGSHNLRTMLTDQLFSDDMRLSERELWEVIDRNQSVCLFILDGYNDNVNEEVLQLITGILFPNCYIILLSDSVSTAILNGFYQEKYVLTGFVPGEAVNFTNKYVNLCRRPVQHFDHLLTKLIKTNIKKKETEPQVDSENLLNESNKNQLPYLATRPSLVPSFPPITSPDLKLNSKQRAGSVVPGLLMGFSKPDFSRLTKTLPAISSDVEETEEEADPITSPEELSTAKDRQTALRFYSQFPLYCSFFCIMTEVNLSVDLTSWSALLEQFFNAIKSKLIDREREGRTSVNRLFNLLMESAFECVKQGLSTTFTNDIDRINKFGVLRKVVSTKITLSSKHFFPNDIIVSFLAAKCLDAYGADETNNFFQNMTLTKSMYKLIIFHCGLHKKDRENASLRTLFRKIVDSNSLISSESLTGGNMMKFQFSLDCVSAMEGRSELLRKVGETLPKKIQIEHSSVIPVLTLQGLSFIISVSCDNIKELDIRLNYLSRQTPDAFQNLANAIHKNTSINILRIYWEQLELMSLFFSTICEKNHSISTIECYDESNHKYEHFNSKVAHNIRFACRSMKNIKSFAFIGCVFPTLTHAVIRNLSEDLELLDLSGCCFTIISCNDLATKIVQSKCLRIIKLANVEMQSMAFNTFIRSFTSNRTVVEVSLNGMKMDNVCFFSLAESLKLNNRLEKLYLLNVIINERNCDELATVMKINNTLKELHVTDDKISPAGKRNIIKNLKNTKLIGMVKEKIKTSEIDKDSDLFTF